ncbi:MAG: hypothetical protein ACREGA_04400 [Candidatus Saccharimonadales bacterium]
MPNLELIQPQPTSIASDHPARANQPSPVATLEPAKFATFDDPEVPAASLPKREPLLPEQPYDQDQASARPATPDANFEANVQQFRQAAAATGSKLLESIKNYRAAAKRHPRRLVAAVALAATLGNGLGTAIAAGQTRATDQPAAEHGLVFTGGQVRTDQGANFEAKFAAQTIAAERNNPPNNQLVMIGSANTAIMAEYGGLKPKLTTAGFNPTDIQSTSDTIQPNQAEQNIKAQHLRRAGSVVLEFGSDTTRGDSQATDAHNIAAAVKGVRTINPKAAIDVMNSFALGSEAKSAAATNAAIAQDAIKLHFQVIDWHQKVEQSDFSAFKNPPATQPPAATKANSQTSPPESASQAKGQMALDNKLVQAAIKAKVAWQGHYNDPSFTNNYYLKYSNGRREDYCVDFAHYIAQEAGHPLPAATFDEQVRVSALTQAVASSDGRNFIYHPAAGYTPHTGEFAVIGDQHIELVTAFNSSTKAITWIGGDQPNPNNPGNTRYPNGYPNSSTSVVSSGHSALASSGVTGYIEPIDDGQS